MYGLNCAPLAQYTDPGGSIRSGISLRVIYVVPLIVSPLDGLSVENKMRILFGMYIIWQLPLISSTNYLCTRALD